MTASRDEQQPQAASEDREAAGSAHAAQEPHAPFAGQDQEERGFPAGSDVFGDPDDTGDSGTGTGGDSAGEVVTVVNPRIVPAGSRTPASGEPSGPTRRAMLVSVTALALVALLVGAFMLFGGGGGTERAGSDATPGPEWEGAQGGALPEPALPAPSESSSDEEDDKDEDESKPPSHSGPSDDKDDGKERPPQDGDDDAPPEGRPPGDGGNGSPGTDRIWNHNSDQCVNVPGGEGRDGTPLQIFKCSGAQSQQWKFASDGTVRALGLCMDVAGGSTKDGTLIQLAHCSGNPAQQFRLSEGSDLVNPQADKCVSVQDGRIQSGVWLVLEQCSGDDSQKWSPV